MEAKLDISPVASGTFNAQKLGHSGELINEGHSATVYRVTYNGDRHVAVKFFKPPQDGDWDKIAEKLKREVATHRELSHENITSLIGFSLEKKYFFSVMEFMEAGDLCDWLSERDEAFNTPGILPPEELKVRRGIAKDVVSAIDYVHQKGIVHADIKPDNIVLTEKNGQLVAKLTDFGASAKQNEVAHGLRGTPDYIPPEHMALLLKYGCNVRVVFNDKLDCYALGLLLLMLLDYSQDVMRLKRHESGWAEPITVFFARVLSHVPYVVAPNLEEAEVLNRLLAVSPKSRPQVASVKDDLFRFWSSNHDAVDALEDAPDALERLAV